MVAKSELTEKEEKLERKGSRLGGGIGLGAGNHRRGADPGRAGGTRLKEPTDGG